MKVFGVKAMKVGLKIFLSFLTLVFSVCCLGGCGGGGENIAEPVSVRVTFPEGVTVSDIGKLLEKNNVCSKDDFIDAVNSAETENEFTAAIANMTDRVFALEGYLFPDTYDFYIGESPQRAIKRFLDNMSSKLSDDLYARAGELGFSMDEIIIIASIIQTEASDESEMKNVSSVLHNRLKSTGYLNMLQCDATFFYIRDHIMPYLRRAEAVTDNSQTASEESPDDYDKLYERISSLYNTYKFGGLPAGPICNPGAAAIRAALYPAETGYYYFVTDSMGNYHYSESYSDHARKCAEFGIKTA
jgi:UPF0755 protein